MNKSIPNPLLYVCNFFLLCCVLCSIPSILILKSAIFDDRAVNLYGFILVNTVNVIYAYCLIKIYLGLITFKERAYRSAIDLLNCGIIGCGAGVFLLLMHIFHFVNLGPISTTMILLLLLSSIILIAMFSFMIRVLNRNDIKSLYDPKPDTLVHES